ncbi:MAG: ribonuclease HII [Gammaproteobacteria bacterium]|nr:ribonuclease HII [Gammaproteobacteria bacterium]
MIIAPLESLVAEPEPWHICGIDEAGRGPLAGPVVAAAVILDPQVTIAGLADSKRLSSLRREQLATQIRRHAVDWSVAWADAAEIDAINILQATMLAMRRAVLGLRVEPGYVEVDGNRRPEFLFAGRLLPARTIVGGDGTVPSISAASIMAKVARDRLMLAYDRLFPQYGFAQHKGYGTADHRQLLRQHGPCQQHRYSFRPIRRC